MNDADFIEKVKALGNVIGDEALADEVLRQAWDRQRLKNARFDLLEARRRAGSSSDAAREMTHREGGVYWMGISTALLAFFLVAVLSGSALDGHLITQGVVGIIAGLLSARDFKKGDAA